MVARTRVTMSGGKELRQLLKQIVDEAPDVGAEALTGWAKDVEDAAEDRVPVRTGNLQSKIDHRVDKAQLIAEVGIWDSGAYYADWVENGTSRQAAQPFLLPSFEQHQDMRPYVRAAVVKRWG